MWLFSDVTETVTYSCNKSTEILGDFVIITATSFKFLITDDSTQGQVNDGARCFYLSYDST